MSKFKINLTKIVSYVGVGIFALAALFVFGVAKADAAITIQGDAYNPSYNLYLFGYTAAQANPCNGVAEGGTLLFSLSNLYDAPNKITPDVNYNDNDDFSTTFDTADGNTFIYLCNGVGGGLGNLLTNSTINTVNGNTYSVDISSVYGTSLDAALNGKNVVVCDELGGTKLNGTARQVAGQTYEQYYLKYSAAGHITLDDVYVLLTDSDACDFDSNVVSGRRADITSATSYNSYGVQIPFSPDTKVDGDAHANLSVAKMELKDASDNSIGLTEAVAVADGAGGSKDYTMYYQEPAASDMTLTITSAANGTTVVSGIDSTAFTAGYDFINDVTDSGALAGVPDDIAAIKTTMDVGGDTIVFTTTRHDTYFYDLYTDIGGAAQTILFQKPAGTTVFQKNVDSSAEGDDPIDVGKVAGSAHADMSTGGNDLFEVFDDDACSSEVSSTNAFGADSAYEVYFEDTGADFWIKTTQDNGGTAYDSCGNHIALTNQAATQNLNRKITAVLPTDQIGASTADTVVIDFNQDVAWTTATDVWTRDIETGTAILYTTSASADGNDDIVVADDNNTDPTDGFGTVLLRRAKDFTLLDATLNVGGVEGDTHGDLNDNVGDTVEIYSDAACTTPLLVLPQLFPWP